MILALALSAAPLEPPQAERAGSIAARAPVPRIADPAPAPVPADPGGPGGLVAPATAPAPASPAPTPAAAPGTVRMAVAPAGVRHRHPREDPLEGINRRFFRNHERFDRAVFRPAAIAYTHILPRFVRSALRNFFSNLGEPVVFVNFLLQRKPGKAMETFGRFVINSGLGLGGTVDVAKGQGIRLPHRPNGFADTLGFYGVKPGPYFFLPLFGPTTLRDFLGGQADGLVLPIAVGDPFDRPDFLVVRGVTTGLDMRAEADADLKALNAGAVDRYATLRSVYLQNRAGEIAHLKGTRAAAAPPAPELGEPLADPGSTHAAPASGAAELSDPLADPAAAGTPVAAPSTAAPASDAAELSDPLADPAAPPR